VHYVKCYVYAIEYYLCSYLQLTEYIKVIEEYRNDLLSIAGELA
jgi:hypothetical protein